MSNLLVSIPQEFVEWKGNKIRIKDIETSDFWGDGKRGFSLIDFLLKNVSAMMYNENGKVFYVAELAKNFVNAECRECSSLHKKIAKMRIKKSVDVEVKG